jgi:hypothetical protein
VEVSYDHLFTKRVAASATGQDNVDLESMKDVTVMSLNRDDRKPLLLAYYSA